MERSDELSLQFNSMNLEVVSEGNDTDAQAAEFSQAGDGAQSSACNLIVNYLPHDIDDNGLRGMFQEFGEIIMTKVVRDKNTKKSLGYGFVKFALDADANRAMEKMHGSTMGHKMLKVSIARPPSLEIRNCKLYVTNLPKEFGEREVVNLFQEFGEIIECRVLRDKNSKFSKGVAFVQFNLKTQATSALSLNGMQLEGATRGLVVKFAEEQHKKKELNRLHNLTMNAAFRGPNGGQGQMNRGNGDDGHGNNGGYFYPPNQSAAIGSLYGRQPNSAGNMGAGLYMPPSPTVPSPVLDYTGGNKGGRKSLQLDIPNFQQMQSQSAGHWYPPVSSPHLGYVPSPSNLVHMGVNPSSNFEFAGGGDFSPAHSLHSMPHMGPLGSHLQPPAGSPHQVGHGLTPFGRVNNHQNQLNVGGKIGAGGAHQVSQNHQPVTVSIGNLPRDTPARNIQGLVSQYAHVLDVHMEEQFYDGPGGRGAATGMHRAHVVLGSIAQAEEVIRTLNGAVLFEGAPPAQVNFA
jgi:RNA recognition motif-containing protein